MYIFDYFKVVHFWAMRSISCTKKDNIMSNSQILNEAKNKLLKTCAPYISSDCFCVVLSFPPFLPQ